MQKVYNLQQSTPHKTRFINAGVTRVTRRTNDVRRALSFLTTFGCCATLLELVIRTRFRAARQSVVLDSE